MTGANLAEARPAEAATRGGSWEGMGGTLALLGGTALALGYAGLTIAALIDEYSVTWAPLAGPSAIALAGALALLCSSWRYRARASAFLVLVFLGLLLLDATSTRPQLQVFYGLVALLAGIVLGPRHAIAAAAMGSVAVALLARSDAEQAALPASLGVIWLVTVVVCVSVERLFAAVARAESHETLAWSYAREAGARRGELVRAKKALSDMYGLLERTNYELAIARGKAEEARHIKAQFAANISHELRTPLNLIMGFSEMMYRSPEVYGEVSWSEELRSDVHEIYRASRHLLGMIDDVLDLARVEAQRLPLKLELVDLGSLTQEAAATARGLLRDSPVALVVEPLAELTPVLADRVRVRQVLLNLLNNAIRFTDSGSIAVTARLLDGEVEVAVADTGVGIPADDLPTIFDEFSQAKAPITSGRGGAGLGLAVCRQFVQLHGGRIWVESELGQGSTFRFTLPLAEGGRARSRLSYHSGDSHAPAKQPGEQSVVVLAANEKVARGVARGIEGYRAIPLCAFEELAEVVEAEHPAGIVLVHDPLGKERAVEPREVWSATGRRDLGVVELQVASDSLVRQSLGVAAYLSKPVQPEELVATVRDHYSQLRSVLVVDDDAGFRALMERALRAAFPQALVDCCADGEEALALLPRRQFDLILLDLVMPGMSGVEMLSQARQAGFLAQATIVVTSGADYGEALAELQPGRLQFSVGRPAGDRRWYQCIRGLLDAAPPDYSLPATAAALPADRVRTRASSDRPALPETAPS